MCTTAPILDLIRLLHKQYHYALLCRNRPWPNYMQQFDIPYPSLWKMEPSVICCIHSFILGQSMMCFVFTKMYLF